MTVSTKTDLITELQGIGRMAVKYDLVVASGGNLSARLPGANEFVITGAATWLDELTPKDFTVMNLHGEVLSGPPPSSEWKLHQRTYVARPDVNSVVHLHPQHAVLLTALGRDIRFFTLDHVGYVGSVGVTPFYPNGSDELADSCAEQSVTHNCVILSNHGCSTVGADPRMAYRRAQNLEEAAIATYRALTLGDSTTVFSLIPTGSVSHA